MKARAWESPHGPRIVIPIGGEELVVSVDRAAAIRDGITAALAELETATAERSKRMLALLNSDDGDPEPT